MKKYNKIYGLLAIFTVIVAFACLTSMVLMCIYGVKPTLNEQKNNASLSAELEETYDFGEGYIKSMVFVGDRTVARLDELNQTVFSSQVWSGEDGTLRLDHNLVNTPILHSSDKKFSSVAEAARIYKPAYMLITVGLDNGVGYCTKEKVKEYYLKLIESVKDASPSTKIILQSVLPVSKKAEKEDPSISNARIREFNLWISEFCYEAAVSYLDTHSVMTDNKGALRSEFDSGDGITPNEAGYNEMLYYIRTHGYTSKNEQ